MGRTAASMGPDRAPTGDSGSGSVPGWLALVERPAGLAVHGIALLLVIVIGAIDWATGADLSISIFYLLPVSLVAWRLGLPVAAAWAVGSAVVWLVADDLAGSTVAPAVQYWNALVRMAFFLIVAGGLVAIRRLWEGERTLAGTDYLTGVLNGRAFHDLVELERSRALRYDRPFTLAYMDVDGFKQVNDTLGHAAGDEALLLIARTIQENIRGMDSVARLGGDEFSLLFPETGAAAAQVAIRKIQERLVAATDQEGLDLTFSIGALVCTGPPESVGRLIQRADNLMYAVKQSGRNGLKISVLDENYGIEAILERS